MSLLIPTLNILKQQDLIRFKIHQIETKIRLEIMIQIIAKIQIIFKLNLKKNI